MDELTIHIKERLLKEPLTVSELVAQLSAKNYNIKNRLNKLIKEGAVGVSCQGVGNVQYFYLTNNDYGILNPITEGKCPTIYAKELLNLLSQGPLWLPLIKHPKYRSLWRAAEELVVNGVLERIEYFVSDYESRIRKPTQNTKTQTLIYALPGYTESELEKALLNVEKFRSKGMNAALELVNEGVFTPEKLGAAAGMARQATDRLAGHLVSMGLIEQYVVGNNRIIYARKGLPEIEVMEFAAMNYLKYAKDIINLSREKPFITKDIIHLFNDSQAPIAYSESVCMRLHERYGVLDYLSVYINGVGKRNLFFRTGTDNRVIDSSIKSLHARRLSSFELLNELINKNNPFTMADAVRETRLTKRGVSYALKNCKGKYTVSRSPFYYFIPNGASEKVIDEFLGKKSNPASIQDRINDYLTRREAFTLNDLLDEFPLKTAVNALNESVNSGELVVVNYADEDVYIGRLVRHDAVIKKIVSDGLDFKKDLKIKAYYFLHSRDRQEISDEFNESLSRVNELIPVDFDEKTFYLIDISGMPYIREQVELRIKYLKGVKMARYDSINRPYSGSFLVISAYKDALINGVLNIPGIKFNTVTDDEFSFRKDDFNLVLPKKIDLAIALMNL